MKLATFWDYVDKSDGCWTWNRSRYQSGYGAVCVGDGPGRMDSTHRVAWRLAKGPIPRGMHVLHRCDNRICVRPDHLFLGTNDDNIADMRAKGRNVDPPTHRGASHHNAKLDPEKVRAIRLMRARGAILRDISAAYGVSIPVVHSVVNRRTWGDVA